MSETHILSLLHYIIALLITSATIGAEYPQQPKIYTRNGVLVLEAAYDRNINMRVSRDSSFLLNDIDIVEKIRQHYTPTTLDGDKTQQQVDVPPFERIKDEVDSLKADIHGLLGRYSLLENGKRSSLKPREVRQRLAMLRRYGERLAELERNMAKDECAETVEPCKNGGTCYDTYKDFHCQCPAGWMGKTCEEDVDECYLYAGTDLGCQNNAACKNIPGSYKCICSKGFSGAHCRLRSTRCDQSQSEELCGHGTCVPANNQLGYTCICDQGWTRNFTTTTNTTTAMSMSCDTDVNECEESRNPCHSECINLQGSFKCGSCPAGYTGNGVTCIDIDECANNNGGCSILPKVRCINTEGFFHCGNCPPGWIGDGHTCELAPSNSCDAEMICHHQAKCEYISDLATCTCPHGMFGHGFGPDGCHTTPTTDTCANHLCKNNGTCLSAGRSTSCLCPTGYSGALCETADGCQPNPCENGGTCKPLANQLFKCACSRGTTGKRCEVIRSVCASIQRWPAGELTYPSDGAAVYAPLERCAWIIRTNPSQILNLTFTSFDVQEDPECSRDWLQIHDGNSLASQLIGRFCGTDLPLGGNILSSQHQLFFWFRSDNATNRPGFHMKWQSQPHVCGDTLDLGIQDVGVIRSPGYPGKTPMSRECQWELSAPYGNRFTVRIYEVNTGSLPNCTGDSLKLYDADLLLKEFCQSSAPQPLKTSSNKLKIHFHTDFHGTDSSFQLHYEVESSVPHCGGVFTEASGLIVGPTDESVCLYLIQQPVGTQIRLEFLDMGSFEIENCNLNSAEIFDGKTDDDESLLTICSAEIPDPIDSSSNYLLIRYKNKIKNLEEKRPFRAKYKRVCEFTLFGTDDDVGVLTTPNYPNPYTEQITCTFHIYGPARRTVRANFTDFSIAESRLPNLSDTEEADISTREFNNLTSLAEHQDEFITYVDVYLSATNKRRYYKGSPMELISELNKMTIVFHATANPTKARGLRVVYSFEEVDCGGVYTENSGSLTQIAPDLGECKYIFEAPEGKSIRFVLRILTENGKGHMRLYGNATEGKNYLLKNVTRTTIIQETFPFNVITVFATTHTHLIGSEYEFVDRKEVCGGNYSSLYGVIKSPNWPSDYPPDMDCVWVITAPLGKRLELTVQNFTLEAPCTGDILEIRNGQHATAPLIGRYCGTEIPSRIPSFANSLYLRFTSDNYIEGAGFHITWEQTETGCGGKLTSYQGSIHSPYISTQEDTDAIVPCDWQIHVAQGSSVTIQVTPYIDALTFCHSERLKIYDGSSASNTMLSLNCSAVSTQGSFELVSSSNEVLIVYTPTYRTNLEFVLDYKTNCKMVLDHVQGVIESPNFPEAYPELLDCNWDIRAGENNNLKVAFSHLSLEATNMECEFDYVEIWDMKNEDILHKLRLCNEIPAPFTSDGNRLIVRFVTDYSNSHNGFRAEYSRVGCGEVFTNEFGTFHSPNYPYSVDLDCDWYIEVPAGKQIVFTLLEFKLEMERDSVDCSTDYMVVKESKNDSISLLKECSTQQMPSMVTSSSNHLYFHFRSGPSRARKGFKALYHTKEASCGGIYRASQGIITSPHYPQNITQEYKCKWEINVPESNNIVLNFKDFEMSESRNCSDSTLTFSKLSGAAETLLETFCGMEKPSIRRILNGRLAVEYTIKPSRGWGRFSLEFHKECGGIITKGSGFIKSQAGENCVWTFNVPGGTLISLNILQFDCYCSKGASSGTSCSYTRGLTILKGPTLQTYCREHQSNMMFEGPTLRIAANLINFRAKYSTVQHSCGGDITSPSGSMASPYYPATYPSNVECTWTLRPAQGNSLQLQIEEMDIAKSDHCNEDFLEVRNRFSNELLGVYCGNQLPDEVLTTYKPIWIRFRSTEGSTGKGFKLKWTYGHLNDIVNRAQGVIESPPLTIVRNDEDPFAWRILVEREKYITLYFEEYMKGLNLFDGYDDTALPITISQSPWRFVSSSNVVYLQTDNDNLQHFYIKWNITNSKIIDTNTTQLQNLTELFIKPHSSIEVTSPGYPYGYEPNQQRYWIFKPFDVTEHVICEVYEVKLELTDSCMVDYLMISTSTDLVQWHEVAKLCNSTDKTYMPYRVVHGTPNVKLDFQTDSSVNRTGFMVRLKTKCGSNFTESVGFINGNKFMYEMECLWRITVKPSRRIRLQLDYAPVDKNNDNDCREYALVYDGLDEHAPLMAPGKICNPQNVSQLVMNSSTNYLTIKYALSLPRPLMPKRWNLTYREYAACNEEYRLIPDADTINITSPNYPNVPHPHTECEWRIVAPRGEIIQVEFVDRFDMNGRFCSSEFLELFDGSTNLARNLGRFCRKPPMLKTTQNVLYMRYLTEINEPRSGFKARISISKCGGSFTDLGGVIRSVGYPLPGSYPSSTQCDYAINLPADATIHFVVQDIHLPFSSGQQNDYLEIIPIGEDLSDVQTLFIYGNTTKDTTFDLNSNKAIVRFHTFGKTTEYRGFSLKYNRFGGQCIQDVSDESGSLIMHFPKRSYYNSFCVWKITVPKGQRVRLEFLNLDDLKQQNATKYPNVAIYNDHEMISKLIAFDVTDNDPHRVILATDNMMLVRIFVPQFEFQFKPLKARYTSDEVSLCPGNIDDDNRAGLIDIQDTQPVFNGNYYCKLRIKLSGEETLAFNITTFENTRNATAPKIYAPLMFHDSVTSTSYRENLTNVMQPHTQTTGFVRIMQSDLEHIHRLRMDYRRHRCGGQQTIRTDLSWKQPEIEDVNYGPIMCVWSLTQPYWSGRVHSEFLMSGNFTFTDSCEREFVLIQEGQWRDKQAKKKICRDNGEQLQNYVFTNRLTYLIYQSQNYNSQATQFSIRVQRSIVCGNEHKVTHFTSNVEVTKDTYKNNQECSWIFFTLPGFYLQLQFADRFFIEDSPNCTKDYLEIQRFEDDLWMPDARFCGRTFPGVYNTSTQRIRVVWHTDDAVTAEGFSFFVRNQCALTLNVTADVQRIVSPIGYSYSGRRLKCEYIFQSNETNKLINVRTILTTFSSFAVNHCSSGGFLVYKRTADGEETEERHCENEFEQRAYKYLRYSYDNAIMQKYTIEYSYDSCGGNITTSHTTIRPLKHETKNSYAHNMNCVWLVKAPADHSIAIRFKYFDTEATFDAVTIYAGNKIQADKLQEKLSGNLTGSPPTIVVDHNEAVITAVSDISSSAKGFEAQVIFLPACNERISLTDGNSPVTLARNFKLAAEEEYMCIYRVTAPKGHRIRIDIRKLQINNSTSSCKCGENCNAIEVFDSVAMQKADMGRFCTVPQTNYSLMSSYEDAVLKFSAKQAALYSFEILLTMERTVCGDIMEYTLGEGGKFNFTFPQNGEQTYAPNIHCTWRFKAAYWMQLRFNYIDIQNASQVTGKCLDYVEVKGKYSSNQHCGHAVNYTTNVDRTDDFNVELTFHSDASVQGKGFEIIFYRGDTCNQTYNSLSDTLTFMNFDVNTRVCNASIVVPQKYTLNLYVSNIYFNNFDCEKLHFRITDTTNDKVLLDRCQTVYSHIDVITTTNAVRLEASEFSSIYLFYTTSERKSTPGCGGIVRNSDGYIASPQYENDRNFSECRWDIIVPAPNIVRLIFNDFNMGPSTNCYLDNVKLIDVLPDGSEKVFKTLCGPELPSNNPGTIFGTSNHVAVISKKSPNFDGIGWNLYFSIERKFSLGSKTDCKEIFRKVKL